jgi:hypothetical protein
MLETPRVYFVKNLLSGMAKGRMSQVMAKGYSFGKILVKSKAPCYGSGYLGYLQGMSQSCPVMIPLRRYEYLSLMLKSSECFRMQYSVPVPLVIGSNIAFFFISLPPLGIHT